MEDKAHIYGMRSVQAPRSSPGCLTQALPCAGRCSALFCCEGARHSAAVHSGVLRSAQVVVVDLVQACGRGQVLGNAWQAGNAAVVRHQQWVLQQATCAKDMSSRHTAHSKSCATAIANKLTGAQLSTPTLQHHAVACSKVTSCMRGPAATIYALPSALV